MLGVADARPTSVEDMIMPVPTNGLKVISIGMLKPRRDQVVAWRGPILDRALTQMLSDVYWGDLDFLLLDLPPGTGDVAISLGQKLPNAEVLVVTTPAERGGRGRRTCRHDGLDDEPAGARRGREHVLPAGPLPPLRPDPPLRRLRLRRRPGRRRQAVGAARLSGAAARSGAARSRAAGRRRRGRPADQFDAGQSGRPGSRLRSPMSWPSGAAAWSGGRWG